jgi:hypothetical protein
MIAQHPVVGVGPDSFARGVGAARAEDYIRLRGPDHYVSGAHNVPLNVAATLGLPALVAWIAMVGAALVALVRRVVRDARTSAPDSTPAADAVSGRWLVGGVAGALTAYLVQAMVSIDALGLLALGAALLGLALGLTRDSAPESRGEPGARTPWVWVAVCACLALALHLPGVVGTTAGLARGSSSASSADAAVPCALRERLMVPRTREAVERVAAEARQAAALDPACPRVVGIAALLTLQQGDAAGALALAQQAIATDPLNARWWAAQGAAQSALGDTAGATTSFTQARRLVRLAPLRQQEDLRRSVRALWKGTTASTSR